MHPCIHAPVHPPYAFAWTQGNGAFLAPCNGHVASLTKQAFAGYKVRGRFDARGL